MAPELVSIHEECQPHPSGGYVLKRWTQYSDGSRGFFVLGRFKLRAAEEPVSGKPDGEDLRAFTSATLGEPWEESPAVDLAAMMLARYAV